MIDITEYKELSDLSIDTTIADSSVSTLTVPIEPPTEGIESNSNSNDTGYIFVMLS